MLQNSTTWKNEIRQVKDKHIKIEKIRVKSFWEKTGVIYQACFAPHPQFSCVFPCRFAVHVLRMCGRHIYLSLWEFPFQEEKAYLYWEMIVYVGILWLFDLRWILSHSTFRYKYTKRMIPARIYFVTFCHRTRAWQSHESSKNDYSEYEIKGLEHSVYASIRSHARSIMHEVHARSFIEFVKQVIRARKKLRKNEFITPFFNIYMKFWSL